MADTPFFFNTSSTLDVPGTGPSSMVRAMHFNFLQFTFFTGCCEAAGALGAGFGLAEVLGWGGADGLGSVGLADGFTKMLLGSVCFGV
ncbi:MAG: hypothetical protein LBU38_03685 [Propionibacteriaceae bacterium]|nr:hypothetical protein [Propionibacteriaceae bacterium]